jgi:predicted transcriptional regulator
MQNRDRTEITRRILDASNGYGDATKTKLVSKVSLNSMQLKEYVKLLTENELICYDLATYTFKTTQKGLKFLYLCNKIDELMMEKEEEQFEVHKERLGLTNTTRQTDRMLAEL